MSALHARWVAGCRCRLRLFLKLAQDALVFFGQRGMRGPPPREKVRALLPGAPESFFPPPARAGGMIAR
jgi:hypothetical protein